MPKGEGPGSPLPAVFRVMVKEGKKLKVVWIFTFNACFEALTEIRI